MFTIRTLVGCGLVLGMGALAFSADKAGPKWGTPKKPSTPFWAVPEVGDTPLSASVGSATPPAPRGTLSRQGSAQSSAASGWIGAGVEWLKANPKVGSPAVQQFNPKEMGVDKVLSAHGKSNDGFRQGIDKSLPTKSKARGKR